MVLATSNLTSGNVLSPNVSHAWNTKLDQVYEKAKLTMANTEDFEQIREFYKQKKKDIKDKRIRTILFFVAAFGAVYAILFLMWGFEENPVMTILVLIVLVIVIFYYFINKKRR